MDSRLEPRTDDWTSQVTNVAIVHLDPVGTVVTMNPGAERLKGYRAADVIGTSFTRFYRAEDQSRGLPGALLTIAAAKGSVEDNGWRVRADGTTFWAHVVITALHDETGMLTGFVKIVTDLTAAKQREDSELAFMRAFAHDFLSPITALRGYVDMLADPSLGTGQPLERIETVTDHLVTMMQELTTRLHLATPPESPVSVDAVHCAREAGELVLPGDAYGRLRFDGSPEMQVSTTPMALRRALANVIDNAAKYSDGVITITSDMTARSARIVISDTGRGIDAADIERIFNPLERGRLSNPFDGGSGIGLASAKALRERFDGEVSTASVVGKGTAVTVLLPLATEPLRPVGIADGVVAISASSERRPNIADAVARVAIAA